MGARLINDSEPECRKLVADCINSMINRLSKSDRDPLFNIIKVWLKEDNVSMKYIKFVNNQNTYLMYFNYL